MSHGSCPTVTIQVDPSEGNPSGLVVINESNFDEATMTKHVVETKVEAVVETPKHEATAAKVVAPWKA